MGAKEGAMILDLIARLREEGNVSIIMILHNYVHVFAACDRVSLIQDGVIALDKPTTETSVDELTEIVVEEYRRARLEAHVGNGAAVASPIAATDPLAATDSLVVTDSADVVNRLTAEDSGTTTENPADSAG
jgi:ABC-type sugar transport system ATPase subunit